MTALRYCLSILLPLIGAMVMIGGMHAAVPVHLDSSLMLAMIGLVAAIAGIYAWGVGFTLAQRLRFAWLFMTFCFVVLLPVAVFYGIVLFDSVAFGIWSRYELPFFLLFAVAFWFQIHRIRRRSGSGEAKPLTRLRI